MESPEYKAAQVFFSQSPKPQEVFVGRWVKTKGDSEQATPETLEQAVNAMLDYTSWYGLGIADDEDIQDADWLKVAAAIESSSVSRILAITTSDEKCLQTASSDDLASKLKTADIHAVLFSIHRVINTLRYLHLAGHSRLISMAVIPRLRSSLSRSRVSGMKH
ncbi:Protein of uncharacterised function (DUF3383) [Escherichia coli]|nr:Protein of uncharacterised function (DUF3383) [Escherichia coli]